MLRLFYVLAVFLTTTPAFIATLWVLEKLRLPGRRPISLRYSRMLCALLRVRVRVVGAPARSRPTLILANHVSWVDIPVISAVLPVVYVAKREIAGWPIVGVVARLMKTVFVDRNRRQETAQVNAEIARRLAEGDPVVLFAEGTSSDGNRVLAFRPALLGAAAQLSPAKVVLQPLAIGYTHLHGLPMGRQHRPLVAWYGDLDFIPHFKEFVRRTVVDVVVAFGQPVPFDGDAERRTMAQSLEATVRRLATAALRDDITAMAI